MTTTEHLGHLGRPNRPGRLVAGAASLLLVLGVSGCGGSDDGPSSEPSDGAGATEPADVEPAAPLPGVTMTAEVTTSDAGIAVHYEATNAGTVPVLLANRLPVPSGAGVDYDDTEAYVTGAGPHAVTISQRVFAAPDGAPDLAQSPALGGTRVAPGETVAVDLTVPLPLVRRQPYGDDLGEGTITLPDDVTEATFCLGVLPADATRGEPDDEGAYPLLHSLSFAQKQSLLCSDPAPVDLG